MEKQVIQSVGFRNIKTDTEITGFQLKIRLAYYRGVYLSQLRPGTLIVDGERFEKEDIIWNFGGEDYTLEDMRGDFKTHWNPNELVTLKVKKKGGLSQGYHDITYGYCFTSSYMPPIIQDHLDPDKELFVIMPEFGRHVNQRRLIMV